MQSDKQLQDGVVAELSSERAGHATRISVEVEDGVVTLAGQVASDAEKWDAATAAQRVPGLKALAVEIDVMLPVPGRRDDGDLRRSGRRHAAVGERGP